jgi:hypothetical protein
MVHLPSAPLGGSSSEAVVKHLFPDSINTNQIDSVLIMGINSFRTGQKIAESFPRRRRDKLFWQT